MIVLKEVRLSGQHLAIYNYIQKHGSITMRKATFKLNINSFTARLSEMRELGIDIPDEWVKSKKHKPFKKYMLGDNSNINIVKVTGV